MRFDMDPQSLANLKAALAGSSPADEFDGLWPANVAIVEAFVLVATQWRVSSLSQGASSIAGGFMSSRLVFIGLDYSAARVALELSGITISQDLWRGLQTMEFAAIAALNED